jgi:hypothetical protein
MLDAAIAKKLSMEIGELNRRWDSIMAEIHSQQSNGYNNLREQYTVLCHQYQLLGESLKIVASVLAATMPDDEMLALIAEHPQETIKNLRERAIVLRPYAPGPDIVPSINDDPTMS